MVLIVGYVMHEGKPVPIYVGAVLKLVTGPTTTSALKRSKLTELDSVCTQRATLLCAELAM
jgi:hypothetical protein